MANKVELAPVTSGYNIQQVLQNNFNILAEYINERSFSKDQLYGEDNTVRSGITMSGGNITGAGTLYCTGVYINGVSWSDELGRLFVGYDTQLQQHVNAALTHANDAATSASDAALYALNAESAMNDSFDIRTSIDKRYLGAKAVEPVVDNQAEPLQVGALYYNTVELETRIWDGTAWKPAGVYNLTVSRETFTATAAQTVFTTVADITTVTGSVVVYKDGVLQPVSAYTIDYTANTITFTAPLAGGELVEILIGDYLTDITPAADLISLNDGIRAETDLLEFYTKVVKTGIGAYGTAVANADIVESNDPDGSGFYPTSTSTLNLPDGGGLGTLVVSAGVINKANGNHERMLQLWAKEGSTANLWYRTKGWGSSWSAWAKVVSTTDLATKQVSNLDALVDEGDYRYDGGVATGAPSIAAGYVYHRKGGDVSLGTNLDAVQHAIDLFANAYFRIKVSGSWQAWQRTLKNSDITTSATDTTVGRVTKVGDFGIGNSMSLTTIDLDTVTYPINAYCSSCINIPAGAGNGWLLCYNLRGNSAFAWQEYQTASSGSYTKYIRLRANGVWQPWIELYHTGNSVNPLDFGVGAASNFNTAYNAAGQPGGLYSVFDDPNGIATYSAAINLPYNSSYSGQLAIRMGKGLGEAPSVYVRAQNGNTAAGFAWSPTVELYHTGNLNVNEFGGDGSGSMAFGFGRDASKVELMMPLQLYGDPSSITVVTSGGNFSLYTIQGVLVASNIAASQILLGANTNKFAQIQVSGLSGIVADKPYVVYAPSGSQIKVNP